MKVQFAAQEAVFVLNGSGAVSGLIFRNDMTKIAALLPLLLASGLVLAEDVHTTRVEYKFEWADGKISTVYAYPGSPATTSYGTEHKDSTCRFESSQGASTAMTLVHNTARTAMFVVDSMDDVGVRTLVSLTSSTSRDDGMKLLQVGTCAIQTGADISSTITQIDSLAWDKKKHYALPDGSVVTVTPHKL